MIEQTVRIHDQHQVELKMGYRLGDFAKAKSYDLALYFFIPASLGVTPNAYPSRKFFDELIGHIRIITPEYALRDLAGHPQCPLAKLEAALQALSRQPDDAALADYERHLKMFCCILKSALRDHVQAVIARPNPADQALLAREFLAQVGAVTNAFRALRAAVNVPTVRKEAFSAFLFADEFVSVVTEFNVYELLEALRRTPYGTLEEFRVELLALARAELEYRNANGYPSVPRADGDNEMMIFRKSVLKKYVEGVLFLAIRTEREGTFAEQTVFALAAGLSMVFATAVAFWFQKKNGGNPTFPFFVALVVSYMFKDRIKEVLRSFFDRKIKRFFFDRRLRIYDDPRERERIGMCRESFDYVKEDRLPPAIWRLRNRDHLTEIENNWLGETVVRYHKRITLLPRWFRRVQKDYRVEGINDILRVNFSKFLQRMDDRRKPIWVCDEDGYRTIQGERVYHVNLVVQCRSGDTLENRRYRIVLTKDGLKRIDPVSAEQQVLRVPAQAAEASFTPRG
jgi:hypothetical protein